MQKKERMGSTMLKLRYICKKIFKNPKLSIMLLHVKEVFHRDNMKNIS